MLPPLLVTDKFTPLLIALSGISAVPVLERLTLLPDSAVMEMELTLLTLLIVADCGVPLVGSANARLGVLINPAD